MLLVDTRPNNFDDFKKLFMNTLDQTITEDNFNLVKDRGNVLYDLIITTLGSDQTKDAVKGLINQARVHLETSQTNDQVKENGEGILNFLEGRLDGGDAGRKNSTRGTLTHFSRFPVLSQICSDLR